MKFRAILMKLKDTEKYILYRPTEKASTNLGGVVKAANGKNINVVGENKLGVFLMTIAGFPGYKIETAAPKEEEE